MLLTIYNINEFLRSGNWPLCYIQGSKKYWQVACDLEVLLSSGETITIPKGFKTDLSSVPRWLWGASSPYGDFLFASLIHDYLYVYNVGTRRAADKEMLLWSNVIDDNCSDNFLRYKAVRWFGASWWAHHVTFIK